jgi:3-hydroxyacyl-[acyl-carrier-protein] dehydratase
LSSNDPERDSRWVQRILPHRYPFLLIDRVLELEPRKRVVAIKNFTINEELFQGHFPGHPVVPGVILLEAMAQAGAILLLSEMPNREEKLLYFTGVDRARFRRPVVPGDQVRLEVEVLRLRSVACRLNGRALVDGTLAAEAICTSAIVDR